MPAVPRVIIVQRGDTLSQIAQRYLGHPNRWYEIYILNAHTLRSSTPDVLYIGERIVLPLQ